MNRQFYHIYIVDIKNIAFQNELKNQFFLKNDYQNENKIRHNSLLLFVYFVTCIGNFEIVGNTINKQLKF